jgi:hypothetical protein
VLKKDSRGKQTLVYTLPGYAVDVERWNGNFIVCYRSIKNGIEKCNATVGSLCGHRVYRTVNNMQIQPTILYKKNLHVILFLCFSPQKSTIK